MSPVVRSDSRGYVTPPLSPTDTENRARIEASLRGETLYGDDFSPDEIRDWFQDEELGYFEIRAADKVQYQYKYHALNHWHGWRHLPRRAYPRVLGLGSAYGEELKPIAERTEHITILEPAAGFAVTDIGGAKVSYVRPRPDGRLGFDDATFDLMTCFGVLHHIPNVSLVVGELARCLKPGGFLLMREPIVSMGDWRRPRFGLTKRERGIPLHLLRGIVLASGLGIVRERKCALSLTSRIRLPGARPIYNSRIAVAIDEFLCRLPIWPSRYHARNTLERLRPTAAFLLLRKRSG